MMHAIETTSLTKRFWQRRSLLGTLRGAPKTQNTAVNGVTFSVREGEIFGLVGPNGAGKTTLIKMLTTLLTPTEGAARIGGFDVASDAGRVRPLVGLVASNERSFYWPLTGRQNMAFFADLYHIPPKEAKRWIEELMELVGLKDQADRRFDNYSTGMRQRLALARGMLTRPKILFMDEPTKGVDPLGSTQIIELIRDRIVGMWKSTLLITTHNLREIERLCDRVAIMNKGEILTVGTLGELRSMATPVDTYRLRVKRIAPDRLQSVLVALNLPQTPRVIGDNGVRDVEIAVPQGGDGLADVIAALVNAGGMVLRCEPTGDSFDDVFHTLLQRQNAKTQQTPKEAVLA